MSKRRLVITAVVVEGRTHAEVAAQYGYSRSWVTRLVGRYKDTPHNSGAGTHYRIRHDIIDNTGTVSLRRAGRIHHISLGRALKTTPVVVIIDDLNI